MIEIKNLVKNFGNKQILDIQHLEINDATVFGLVGINGAGKTTLLRLIAGILKADSGEILIDGENVYENEFLKKDLFFVGDESYFPRNATINSLKEFYKTFYDFDEERYIKCLNILKLDPSMNINNFSKGMKRQIFLLMALSIMPKIILLDEAFDGLDTIVRMSFKKLISELVEEKKAIIIISSHNLKELEDICDSYAILDAKKIINYGDLYENLHNIYKIQVAFSQPKEKEFFEEFNLIDFKKIGKVNTLVVKGEIDEILDKLQEHDPILLETLSVSFEEMFIYEVEAMDK